MFHIRAFTLGPPLLNSSPLILPAFPIPYLLKTLAVNMLGGVTTMIPYMTVFDAAGNVLFQNRGDALGVGINFRSVFAPGMPFGAAGWPFGTLGTAALTSIGTIPPDLWIMPGWRVEWQAFGGNDGVYQSAFMTVAFDAQQFGALLSGR